MKCEKCKNNHNGKYGSGRFCSSKCARSFSTLQNRKEINQKVSKSLSGRYKGRVNATKGKKMPEKGRKLREYHKKNRIERISTLDFEDLYKSEQREVMLVEQKNTCCSCDIGEFWNGKALKFELDHVDGNKKDNSRKNLRLICPNCHQQTPTYKGKNNKQANKVSDEQVINALLKSKSGYETLKRLGMSMHGKNYEKMRKVINEYNVKLEYIV